MTQNPERLQELRGTLVRKLRESPLFDGLTAARNLEEVSVLCVAMHARVASYLAIYHT